MAETYCPFCGFEAHTEYEILYHLEDKHAEGDSPFIAKSDQENNNQTNAQNDPIQDEYADCPIKDCGETIHISELGSHVEMHAAEDDVAQTAPELLEPQAKRVKIDQVSSDPKVDTKLSEKLQITGKERSETKTTTERQSAAQKGWKELLKMPESTNHRPVSESLSPRKILSRRLGKSELGPHHKEDQMPVWLRKLLETDGEPHSVNRINAIGGLKKVEVIQNYASEILPVVARLLHQDSNTEYAYTCHPCVKHISKLKNEGGFCGYRNIQMLTSYIIGAQSQGYQQFDSKIPTIFLIQDFIEHAWDLGINKQGRQETGGIRGTRKYIGTPEAQAMFCSLNISCDAQGLKTKGSVRADQLLLDTVEDYFTSACTDFDEKVRRTSLPPIYFQHPGHSLTIIGMAKQTNGTRHLVVFDPMFYDSPRVTSLVGQRFHHKKPDSLLKAYLRGGKYLQKYNEFEILKLTSSSHAPPKSKNST